MLAWKFGRFNNNNDNIVELQRAVAAAAGVCYVWQTKKQIRRTPLIFTAHTHIQTVILQS